MKSEEEEKSVPDHNYPITFCQIRKNYGMAVK